MNLIRVFGDLTPRAVALLDLTGSEPSELDGEPATLYTGTGDEETVAALEPGTRLRQSTSFWDYGEDLDVPAPPKDDVTWLGACGDAGVALPSV